MSDLPPDNPDAAPGDPVHTLNDILAALSRVGEDAGDEAADGEPLVQDAVSELSAALDQLFTLVRSDRAEQNARIAELEAALSVAHARIRQLEAGEQLDDIPAPPPNDFGQLREAAERLRRRTEELFREAGPVSGIGAPSGDPLEGAEDDTPLVGADEDAPLVATDVPVGALADETPADPAEARMQAARDAVESSIADEHHAVQPDEADEPKEFGKPAVLKAFPGTAPLEPTVIDVESDLQLDGDEEPEAQAAAVALPVPAIEPDPAPEVAPDDASSAEPKPEAGSAADAELAEPPVAERRPEPVEIAPRPARKRRAGLRRRRIDARKLASVDPATALRAMVSSIDDIWTTGVTLDLVIALTDGGSLKVSGGHNKPLSVVAVKPGTPARTTVTATTAQLVPLFGRLELTDEQSPPLIHGPRRDADLLVGWIDRAQRLEAPPL